MTGKTWPKNGKRPCPILPKKNVSGCCVQSDDKSEGGGCAGRKYIRIPTRGNAIQRLKTFVNPNLTSISLKPILPVQWGALYAQCPLVRYLFLGLILIQYFLVFLLLETYFCLKVCICLQSERVGRCSPKLDQP